jgi:hypothetical protein
VNGANAETRTYGISDKTLRATLARRAG